MNTKLNIQQQMTNGLFIRKEIQRFESVHPNIYSVYDLIDTISDFNLQQQIREHIVNIEGKRHKGRPSRQSIDHNVIPKNNFLKLFRFICKQSRMDFKS
jgi:hypothetical protein